MLGIENDCSAVLRQDREAMGFFFDPEVVIRWKIPMSGSLLGDLFVSTENTPVDGMAGFT